MKNILKNNKVTERKEFRAIVESIIGSVFSLSFYKAFYGLKDLILNSPDKNSIGDILIHILRILISIFLTFTLIKIIRPYLFHDYKLMHNLEDFQNDVIDFLKLFQEDKYSKRIENINTLYKNLLICQTEAEYNEKLLEVFLKCYKNYIELIFIEMNKLYNLSNKSENVNKEFEKVKNSYITFMNILNDETKIASKTKMKELEDKTITLYSKIKGIVLSERKNFL